MYYNIDKAVSGWRKDLDKQMIVKARLERDLILTFILSYCQHHKVTARVMVKIVRTEKKALIRSMGVQVLSKMVTLMLVNQRPIEKEVNCKSDGTPIGTPDSKFEGKLMCTLLNETSSNYVNRRQSEVNYKSEGTPISTPNFKSDCTPMHTDGHT
jgi:hypothetical protein